MSVFFMQEVILKLIEQLNSSVFILLLVLIVVVYAVYKLGFWTHKFAEHDKKVDKLEGLAEQIITLKTKVDLIYQNTNPNSPVRSMSPLSLTQVGKNILDTIDGVQIFDKYKDALIQLLEACTLDNAYDIQKWAIHISKTQLEHMLNSEELFKIKEEAFKNGILVEDILGVFGLLLRDEELKRKKISLDEVDKHSPEL